MKAINLLPPDLRGTPKGATPKAPVTPEEPGGIGAFVVLGALAACVLALAAYVLTTNTVKDRQAQLEAATANAEATTQRVNQLKPYADFQAMAETRIQTVKDLASSRFDWEQALRDISRAVPGSVTLSEINGTISTDAGGSSGLRSAIAAPAIELKGCTHRSEGSCHAALAAAQRRRRHPREPRQVAQAGGVRHRRPVADRRRRGGVLLRQAPPEFELVVFFERSEVPQTVEDITVQPGAGSKPSTGAEPSAATETGSTTEPPADPSADPATPASTPQGDAQ